MEWELPLELLERVQVLLELLLVLGQGQVVVQVQEELLEEQVERERELEMLEFRWERRR